MDISRQLRTEELTVLCANINLPGEVSRKIAELAANYSFAALNEPADLLFSCVTGPEGVKTINERLGQTEDALFVWLAIWLAAALRTHEQYRLKGIDDAVFYATMGCFSRFTKEHQASYGTYGFDRSDWTYRMTAMQLFRVGTLEFEMTGYRGVPVVDDGQTMLRPDEPVLYVHIPSDARLDGENCHQAYTLANSFFRAFYPDFPYRVFYTNTWLLSPQLRRFLPEGSGILNFQNDYRICAVDEERNDYRAWVFKNPRLEPADFPENTSLQRNIKKHVLGGGKIGAAAGIIDRQDYLPGIIQHTVAATAKEG